MKQMEMFPTQPVIRRDTKAIKEIAVEDNNKSICPHCNTRLKNEATGYRCYKCGYFIDRY